MNHFGFTLIVLGIMVVLWARAAAKKSARSSRKNPWSQPPDIVVQAAKMESLGLTSLVSRRNAIDTSPTYNSKTEVHMNPISAVIFIIFIGGAVLARVANMPISVTVVLALIGIFLAIRSRWRSNGSGQ